MVLFCKHGIVVVALAALLSPNAAAAVEMKRSVTGVTGGAKTNPGNVRSPSISAAPLSVNECTRGNGTVIVDAFGLCTKGLICTVKGLDGATRNVCITSVLDDR